MIGTRLYRIKRKDYKDRQVDEKYRKVFVFAHVVLRTAAIFVASAPNRGNHPRPKTLKMANDIGNDTSV